MSGQVLSEVIHLLHYGVYFRQNHKAELGKSDLWGWGGLRSSSFLSGQTRVGIVS